MAISQRCKIFGKTVGSILSARVVKVIEIVYVENEFGDNPRAVTQYRTLDGDVLAEVEGE